MKFFIYSLALIFIFTACNKDKHPGLNDKGQVEKLNHIWKYGLHENNEFNSNSIIGANLVFEDKILLGTTTLDKRR